MSGSPTTDQARILDPQRSSELDARWNEIQPRFVDDPQAAVGDADRLVSDTIEAITSSLDDDRSRLQERWNAGEEPSTEDLRQLLQRYRDLFSRLLDV